MTINDNRYLISSIEAFLTAKLPIRLGINKRNELVRLIYEISCGQGIAFTDVIRRTGMEELIKAGKNGLFHRVKKALLKERYPHMVPESDPRIVPFRVDNFREECPVWDFELKPRRIFIEKGVQSLEWTETFLKKFPETGVEIIGTVKDVIGEGRADDRIGRYNSRRDRVFLVRSGSGFVKKCPCTKKYKRCGYWILNLGFGCPIDCAYCYLQMYSNAPGIILPANIEDFLRHVERFNRRLVKRTRIGTGEFTDSLALDRYTGYSSYLIPFFRETKKLILELKTKSGDIANILREKPHDNVVISWSMNTPYIAAGYEKGGINIDERIDAALQVAEKGYRVGFHFDPVVYYKTWEEDYKSVIEKMFSFDKIRRNTAWISLGTLRYAPGFKQVIEQRFAENNIFYEGEFFTDTDEKLRYPRKLRLDMYTKMAGWIRSFNTSCWIYLCMEPAEMWEQVMVKGDRFWEH